MVDFRLIGAPIVLDSFYHAETFVAHFISQVVDDIVDTVRKGQRARVMAIVNFHQHICKLIWWEKTGDIHICGVIKQNQSEVGQIQFSFF